MDTRKRAVWNAPLAAMAAMATLAGLAALAAIAALLAAGCGAGVRFGVWRDQALPSGRVVKVTMAMLAWDDEHGERNPKGDAFSLEYVRSEPGADAAAREREALEVFELIRPTSELWGLRTATLAGFPAVERRGRYDLFVFRRGEDGAWAVERRDQKVFVDD